MKVGELLPKAVLNSPESQSQSTCSTALPPIPQALGLGFPLGQKNVWKIKPSHPYQH